MTCDHAKELIAGSWQNELSSGAESSLRQHVAECDECRLEMAALGGVWQRLGDLPVPEPSHALTSRWEATLASLIAANPKPRRTWTFADLWPRNPAWQGAFAMACLVIGLVVGNAWPRQDKEISKLHQEIASTREMVALSLLQQQTATERLRGVEYSTGMKTMEPEIVSALVHAINEDSSVNVRLAAIDALGKASGNRSVVTSLARSLPRQESPMVQAALVDYFVDARDHQAVGALQQLTMQPDLNPAVLERTRYALRELSQ
ncbi:MAG TPA: HEAT repeat domain-containing protein [Bryobacteraceae bacterium]|jgi:hypothetical protein|nr:HEAT repeat domain-containing protein [Bryobacteraceae bacterium]